MKRVWLIVLVVMLCFAMIGCEAAENPNAEQDAEAAQGADADAAQGADDEQKVDEESVAEQAPEEGVYMLSDLDAFVPDDLDLTKDYGSTITEYVAVGTTAFAYYPTPNASDYLNVSTSCTAPIFVVFGDTAFTEEEAITFANESGLAAIAAANGSSVVFPVPKDGESWTDADEKALDHITSALTSDSSEVIVNGLNETGRILSGTGQRVYLYGIGSGADYIAGTQLKKSYTVAGCTLTGVSDVSGVQDTDIPVVSIDNSDEANAVLEEKCGMLVLDEESDYVTGFYAVIGQYRRQTVLIPRINYTKEGITEIITSSVLPAADGDGDEKEINYLVYYDENLDMSEEVPLVLTFHGGGNTALYLMQGTEWPLIAKENGFIVVSVDNHVEIEPAYIISLIEHLKQEYPIDSSRIYASGFSMGSVKTFACLEQYPEVFAGFAPMSGSFAPAEVVGEVTVPVFYIGGGKSPLAEIPTNAPNLINRIQTLFDANDVIKAYDVSVDDQASWEDLDFGVSGDVVYSVDDKERFVNSVLTVSLYQSEDEKYYTAVTIASEMGHVVYARNTWAAWDFLSQFSRAEDGTIEISEVEYAWPASDGSVVDNSYNQ